jgi:hypothetical protein
MGTSWRGLKTPFSYFAGMVMLVFSILRGEPVVLEGFGNKPSLA